jgi:hypothetical protein
LASSGGCASRARPVESTTVQRMKTARLLVVATLTFLAIAMRLKWTIGDLDGKSRQQLTWWQQILEKH